MEKFHYMLVVQHNGQPCEIYVEILVSLSYHIYQLEDSGSAENKEILLFSYDKLLLASILRPLHQVTKEMLV